MALNDKHEKFCQEYLKDLNGSAAYKRVYPKAQDNTARDGASKLLAKPDIMSRISELKEKRAERQKLSGDMVVKRLADIAFAHIGLICVWDEHGNLTLKDQKDLSEGELAAIDHIQCTPVSDGDGGLLGYSKRVKMKDSLKALELLSKHLGLLDGKHGDDGGRDKESAAKRILDAVGRLRARREGKTPGDQGEV